MPYTKPINLVKIVFFSSLCLIGYVNVIATIILMATGKDKF